jgi:tetratricopeptide (TPR) repeat protein
MTRLVAHPNPNLSGEAAVAASLAPPRRTRQRRLGLLVALIGLLTAVGRLAWFTPAVQEWRFTRASFDTLLAERRHSPQNPRLLTHIGMRLNAQERFAEAESNLRIAAALDPDSARTRDAWASALLGTGRVTDAFNQLRQFVGTHPESAPGHRALGRFYFTQRAMQRAREEFERTVAIDPSDAAAWAYLSQAADQLAVANRPREAALKAVELAPKNAGYHLLLASLYQRTNAPAEAGRAYARASELAPDNALMHQQYGLWLAAQTADPQNQRRAEAQARRALALDDTDGTTHLLLGRLLRHSDRPQEALEPLIRAATLSPSEPAPAQELTLVYTALRDTTAATLWADRWHARQRYVTERDALFQQLRMSPTAHALRRRMGQLLGTHGDVEGSLRNYAMALRRAPDDSATLIATAGDLVRGGHVALALPLAERAVALAPHSPNAHEVLADALLQSGQMNEAVAQFNYTTSYAPDRAKAIQTRVNRYAAAHPQPLSPAERAYREARALVDDQIGLRRSPQRALERVQTALTLDPGNIRYLYLQLELQFGARKIDGAIATARKLIVAAPDDARTRALLATMLADRAASPEEFALVQTYLDETREAAEAAPLWHYATGLLALQRRDGPRAVIALTEAARQDPDADIALFKLSQAQRLCGHVEAAEKTLVRYRERQARKAQEFQLQSAISTRPDDPDGYERLADFYHRHGRIKEERAIRMVLRQRTSTAATRKQ